MEQILPFILAFFGGIFGAVIGGATSFILFGFMAIIGIAVIVGGGSPDFLNSVALSPIFGSQAAFIGGFAAAAFTAKLSRDGKLLNADGSQAEEFIGANIFAPLAPYKNISILLVGGVFGVIRTALLVLLDEFIGLSADNTGVAVFLGGFIVRLVFGDAEIMSNLPAEANKGAIVTENLAYNVL